MNFDIVTTVTANYVDAVPLFVPSWLRNSGARQVRIFHSPADTFYEAIIDRNVNLMAEVCHSDIPIVALDLDCFVIRSLAGGFAGKPFGVARWPNVNMGVAFFDTRISYDWVDFFKPLVNAITVRCRNPKYWDRPEQKGRFGDQYNWIDALKAVEPHVHKLDMNEWNFCHQPEDWDAALRGHREHVRVIHIKGRGDWHLERYQKKIDLVRELFPDKVKE